MKLSLIRHTSVSVEPGICYGQSDVGLASSFENEKENLAKKINGEKFNKIFSSPLSRCKILAENLFEKEEIVFDKRLKELNFGDWELKAWNEIYSEPEGKVWMDNYQTLPALNGESYLDMVKRILEFYEDIKECNCESVAIVAHAGVIRIFKSIIENQPIDELFTSFKPDYGSVTEFEL